jgi:hypothetical protein
MKATQTLRHLGRGLLQQITRKAGHFQAGTS